MANRTQIVCLHEGKKGRSIDPVFINALIKALDPSWLRPNKGSNLKTAQAAGISEEEFSQVVFAFAKDRLENWIQFLNIGSTDESVEGPRVKHNREVADAAKILAKRCLNQTPDPPLPPSLVWSCLNWKRLVARMK